MKKLEIEFTNIWSK